MAEDDIYCNKKRYEMFLANLEDLKSLPKGIKRKYYSKNPINIKYFKQLHKSFERKDFSFKRIMKV